MLLATRGIVLKTVKYSESSIIAKIYTEEFGLRSYIVKGVTGKKSHHKKSLLQGLSLLNMVVYEKSTAGLQNIREMEPAFIFKSIPYDIRKSTIAMFLNEIMYKSLVEEVANREMFSFIFNRLQKLDTSDVLISEYHIRFLIDFSGYLGFWPRNNFSDKNRFFDMQEGVFVSEKPVHQNFLDGETSRNFSMALQNTPERICPTQQRRNELLEKIILYYSLHVPAFGELKSFDVLKQVLNS